jgi:hypothetical protein
MGTRFFSLAVDPKFLFISVPSIISAAIAARSPALVVDKDDFSDPNLGCDVAIDIAEGLAGLSLENALSVDYDDIGGVIRAPLPNQWTSFAFHRGFAD